MINLLKNPKTKEYVDLKQKVLGPYFPWHYHETCTKTNLDGYTNNPIYMHEVLSGPSPSNGIHVSVPRSDLVQLCDIVVTQIFRENNLNAKFIHRIGINCVHYYDGNPSVPHLDHDDFEHKNLIFYLNKFSGGQIDVFFDGQKKTHFPSEDDIITFDCALHSIHQPTPGCRRIVMTVTYS